MLNQKFQQRIVESFHRVVHDSGVSNSILLASEVMAFLLFDQKTFECAAPYYVPTDDLPAEKAKMEPEQEIQRNFKGELTCWKK